LQKEALRKRAQEIINIPDHFHPVIEEYFEGDDGEALFPWTNEAEDKEIVINLDLAGHLTSLSIESESAQLPTTPLDKATRKIRAEEFLGTHYPNALSALTLQRTTEHEENIHFYYEQMVAGLPLALAGCFIKVDPSGQVIEFRYDGVKPHPNLPNQFISTDTLKNDLQRNLEFELKIVQEERTTDAVKDNGLRLVYEPKQYVLDYIADQMTPTLTVDFDEDQEDYHTYVPLLSPSEQPSKQDRHESIETFVGIPEQMEIIREVDTGEETGIVWRDKDWVKETTDLSIADYFEDQSGDTVKAFISNTTGQVTRFLWFKQPSSKLQLDTASCYQRAIDFLHEALPGCDTYLQRIICDDNDVAEEDGVEEDEQILNETFFFGLFNAQDIPVGLEMISVSVSPVTGEINEYGGPSFEMKQLDSIPGEARISKQEARAYFIEHVDFQLAWDLDYDEDPPADRLVYQVCERQTKKKIHYVDAITGALILETS